MPNIKSAKKRVIVNAKKTEQNKAIRSAFKTEIKKVEALIKENKLEFSKKSFGLIMKNLKTRNDKNMFDMQTVSGYLNSILK